MKSPAQVVKDVTTRLSRTWAAHLTGVAPAWPHAFPIGQPTSADLAGDFATVVTRCHDWHDFATAHRLQLQVRTRRVGGTTQELPTHLHVPTIDAAAALAGDGWPARVTGARDRASHLAARFPHLSRPEKVLTQVAPMSEVDFDLACRAAEWFATHDPSGYTPRQVPIEGLHAKWLNTRQGLIATLAGREDLGLLPPHPPRIHFTYLDPDHRAASGRIHDSATVGDTPTLAYTPSVVLISENKDTAIHFPTLPGGIAVEGVGRGGRTAAAFDWIRCAPAVYYWGDMDADGLEILNEFRAAGVPATSLLMDTTAYRQWARFGTNTAADGTPLRPRTPRDVPHLGVGELALYQLLCSEDLVGPRRIEQERIPLHTAHRALLADLARAAAG